MEDKIRRASVLIALDEVQHLLEDTHEPPKPTRQPFRQRGESGAEYIHRLLTENPHTCLEQLRLDRDMFIQLMNIMLERKLLEDAKYIKVPEQVAICLFLLAKENSYRDAKDTFKHTVSTIGRYFKQVLDALVILSFDIIRPHRDLSEMQPEVQPGTKYWPYLKDAIGALDGTHIDAVISDENGVPFRNRKGTKTWNVLASCSFDRIYTYINVGWEGSAHDITVWKDSLTSSKFGFPHPPSGKFFLVDSGYPNTFGYLAPFSETRRHMPEFKVKPPRGKEEYFNYLHSSLRMKVECSFGQLKKRWKILKNMPQMSLQYQMAIIVSCFTLHNFIRMHTLGIPIIQNSDIPGVADVDLLSDSRKKTMGKVRRRIARQIWMSKRTDSDTEDEHVIEEDVTDTDQDEEMDENLI